jgi:hypothetical protein
MNRSQLNWRQVVIGIESADRATHDPTRLYE